MLEVDTLSALLFNTKSGNQLMHMLNVQLASLIKNDQSFLEDSIAAPTIWECKWLNDSTIAGYRRGQSVWLNTASPQSILNTRYEQIVQYASSNPILRPMLQKIDEHDQVAMNKFLTKVILGTASPSIPALYCLGDIHQPVQIRVSTVDNNKVLPTDNTSCWYDFYTRDSMESNILSTMECLSSALSSQLSEHIDQYHISSLSEEQMDAMGFFKRDPFEVSSIQCQAFYDHAYCESMDGFDYVVDWKATSTQWYRQWRSGYLEQGGFVQNIGDRLLEVKFMKEYNYPIGQRFYQNGYDVLAKESDENTSLSIHCRMNAGSRYVLTVTPQLKTGSQYPYSVQPKSFDGTKVYASVDAANLANSGFSIVNADTGASIYSKYSWHTAGYCVV